MGSDPHQAANVVGEGGLGLKWVGLAAIVLLIGGCGRSESVSRSDKITLQFWNGFSGPDGATMEKIVKSFNASQDGIQVEMQIIPWATYYDKVTLGLAFGGAPDVFILHAHRIPEYASHHALLQLDSFVRAGQFEAKDYAERPWHAAQYQGQQMGIPLDCHPLGMYYNLDRFAEAGITEVPTNYDEFVEVCRKLEVSSKKLGRTRDWPFAFTWLHSNGLTFLNQFGTSFLSADLSHGGMSGAEGQQALGRMVQLWKDDKIAPQPAGQDAWLGFLNGTVAIAFEGVYMKSGLDNQKGLRYAAAPVPQFGPVKAVWAGSHVLCVPASIDVAKRDAALKFMSYVSDHSLDWAAGGQIPVRKSLLDTERFRAMRVQYNLSQELDYVVYEPCSPRINQVGTFGDAAIESALNENSTIAEATAQADRRSNAVLSRGARQR